MVVVQKALISVSDKKGIVEFARGLKEWGIEIISTGGTAQTLREGSVSVIDISEVTGFPEMLDGRIKTLHPKIHGGILGRRDHPDHMKQMRAQGIDPIDMVVVNLYPFQATVARSGSTLEEAIEQIDIGGPAMVRAAAKNYQGVAVIVDHSDYGPILDELRESKGTLSNETTFRLAKKAFQVTAKYDRAIAEYLDSLTFSSP